jgi:hypothetical protein
MWRRAAISTGLVLAAAVFAAVEASSHGATSASAAPVRAGCAPRALVTDFLAAFNRGDLRRVDRLVAPRRQFRHYTVSGAPGERVGEDARIRSTLIEYLGERRSHSEQLLLTWFDVARRGPATATFRFDVVRSADDLEPSWLYRGTGAVNCAGRRRLVSWAMAPNTELSFPAPQSYAETCRLVSTWCQTEPTPGGIPDALRRPLAFPRVPPGADCPVTSGRHFENGQFGGLALGEGPVQPIVTGGGSSTEGLRFRAYVLPHARPPYRGWYSMKTLWFARPEYRGPVFIRGRQLDGPHTVVLGEGPSLVDPQLGPGDTINGIEGWRQWPGGTDLRTPGCYAWQVDGTDFSHVIVFKAVFR